MRGPRSTDAVYRYLLVQYGISPFDLAFITEPVRVGDVIVLPDWSFAQAEPQEHEWDFDGVEPEKRCIAHGFFGRWKRPNWRDV